MSKFIEMEISRTDSGITIKAKSERMAEIVKEVNSQHYGGVLTPSMTETGCQWGRYEFYKCPQGLQGWLVNTGHQLSVQSIPNCPWLLHKNLATGIEMKLQFPASATAVRTYAEQIKDIAERYYKDNFAPFRFEVVIHVEDEE